MRLRFLGTGASGGTPGRGRSARQESSALIEDGAGAAVLVDATRHFAAQARGLPRLDAVLLTHAHRDAAGGVARLRRRRLVRGGADLPVYASPATHAVLRRRFARLDGLELVDVEAGRPFAIGPWTVRAVEVPHAREAWCPTFAWRLADATATLVYASDVAALTPQLEEACAGATALVIDGAMWGRSLFSHLRIDRALPVLCGWPVGRIVLTQIGRSAPPHARLAREVAALCARASPAYDGLEIELPGTDNYAAGSGPDPDGALRPPA